VTDEPERRVVGERTLSRDCRSCGTPIALAGEDGPRRGRVPRYCSPACRQKAWALRRAADALGREDPRPTVVRELVERVVEVHRVREVPGPPVSPVAAADWVALLELLGHRLADPASAVARDHYAHRRIYDGLLTALEALDRATPGGLALLDHREPPG
jgi:hypothetical protein